MILTRISLLLMLILLQNDYATGSSPQVFITIDAYASVSLLFKISENSIQVNWYNATPKPGDWVGLFSDDPTTDLSSLRYKISVKTKEGMVDTNSSLPRSVSDLPVQQQCFHFWVAYVSSNNQILSSNCFKARPFWMWENRQFIGKMSLPQMMIPGTHDSGSYRPYLGWISENVATKYAVTQSFDIWDQFVFGIRFLDIRVGYYTTTGSFWLVHGPYVFYPLEKQLDSIKDFISSTKEIVILGFHGFEHGFRSFVPGRKQKRHKELVSLVIDKLGDYLIPRSYGYNATLDTLWKNNKRILLCYNHGDFYKTNQYLWPGVYHAWAQTYDIKHFFKYFDGVMKNKVNHPLWSAQAAVTPDVDDWIITPFDGLRIKGDEVNPLITKHARELWWDKANIIATDFFEGNDVIDVSIESNKKRAKKM